MQRRYITQLIAISINTNMYTNMRWIIITDLTDFELAAALVYAISLRSIFLFLTYYYDLHDKYIIRV